MAKLRWCVLMRVAALSLSVALLSGPASGASTPPVVPNGVANCVWLKVKARGSGYELRLDSAGLGPKRTIAAECYMQLVWMAVDADHPHGQYGSPLLCPVDFENWAASPMDQSFTSTALLDGNTIAVDDYLTFTNAAGDIIQGYGTHRVLIAVDPKTQAFKKATFQTIGGEMIDGSHYALTPADVIGGYTATGTSVTADKVPQPAKDLVAASPCP
jgi:hypothetical protein